MKHTASLLAVPVVAFALVLSTTRPATACSCATQVSACNASSEATAIFVGRVTATSGTGDATLAVTERFVGPSSRTLVIRGGNTCSVKFTVGQEYLVYASQGSAGLTASICSRTRALDATTATDDLALLRDLQRAPGQARLRASARHVDRDYSTHALPPPGMVPPIVAGVKVTAHSRTRTFSATTDRDGRFDLRMPAGTYTFAADPGPGLYADGFGTGFELTGTKRCRELFIAVRYDGRVAGRVVTSTGAPIPHLSVELGSPALLDGFRTWPHLTARTDTNGRFEVSHIPPGQYILGVNTVRGTGGERLFPRAFFPGLLDETHAQHLDITPGGRMDLGPFVLPNELQFTTMSGVVLDPSGRTTGATVALTTMLGGGLLQIETAADGRFFDRGDGRWLI